MATLFSGLVQANALTALDPRSMSLGGAGVASTRPYNASFFNPARFAGNPRVNGRHDEHAFSRFYLGLRLIDRDGFIDAVDQYQENDNSGLLDERIDQLEAAIEARDVSREDFRAVTRAGNALLDDFQGLSDKPLRLAASAGFNAGQPGERWGLGAHVRQNAVVGMEVRVSESDIRAVRDVLDFVDLLLEISETGVLPDDVDIPRPTDDFTSDFALQGALVRETGISVGHRISGQEDTIIGVTVKSLYVETLDWLAAMDDADSRNFDLDDQRRAHSDVNLDLGVIHELDEHWNAGLMIRNVLARDYQTVRGNRIRLRPVVRAGLAYQSQYLNVALDMDLNEAEAIGFDPAKQYVSIGAEYRPLRWLALRGGYRYETVLREGNPSAGLGVSFRRGHLDFAVSGDTGDSFGLGLQFGLRF